MNKIVEELQSDTDCLWQIVSRIRNEAAQESDARDGIHCYLRLKANLTEYTQQRLDIIDSAFLWFMNEVLVAFEDIYTRFVAKVN